VRKFCNNLNKFAGALESKSKISKVLALLNAHYVELIVLLKEYPSLVNKHMY
jgi:hypothetical protein